MRPRPAPPLPREAGGAGLAPAPERVLAQGDFFIALSGLTPRRPARSAIHCALQAKHLNGNLLLA